MKRFFKLINDEVIFGQTEVITTEVGQTEVLVRMPYTAKNGNIMPYMIDVMGESPAAVSIHPMNIIWSVPLDEFPMAEKLYSESTGSIITEKKEKIVI